MATEVAGIRASTWGLRGRWAQRVGAGGAEGLCGHRPAGQMGWGWIGSQTEELSAPWP